MDPTTVVFLLSLQLLVSGGLLYLIGLRLPARSGLDAFAAGAALFGLAYGTRLVAGASAAASIHTAIDVAMMVSVLFFTNGLREFMGRDAWGWRVLAAASAVFLALDVAIVAGFGIERRYVAVNGILAVLYALLAAQALDAARRSEPALRVPMGALCALAAGLAALNVGRAISLGMHGSAALYRGTYAQVFYVSASLAALLFGPLLLWMVFVRLNAQLENLATHDALTRLLNRNGLDEALHRHFAARAREPLRLLLVDIDHFKQVNDRHGHAAGDRVLRAVAETLASHVRAADFVARFGGEEFVVGCIGGTDATALALAERLRAAVQALEVAPGAGHRGPIGCTVTIGVSRPVIDAGDWEPAVRDADTALYGAKRSGRNRVGTASQCG